MQGTRVVILLLLGAVLHLVDVEAARLLAGHGDPSDYNYSHAGARGRHHRHGHEGRPLMAHSAIKVAAAPMDCNEAVCGAGGAPNSMAKREVLMYQTPQQKPLLLHLNSTDIMGWILGNEGEARVNQLFAKLFSTVCANHTSLFLDVGANAGFYSLLALSYDCQALMFDPQPACVELINHQLCLNSHYPIIGSGLGVGVINRPVSEQKKSLILTEWDQGGARCQGSYSVDVQSKQTATAATKFIRDTIVLDDLLMDTGLHLTVVKIDTEGFEVAVLRSMRRLLQAKRVSHMVVEVTPVFWKRDGIPRETVYQEFESLLGLGCQMGRVMDVELSGAVPVIQNALDTPEKLKQYLVERDFVQEDLYVKCPEA